MNTFEFATPVKSRYVSSPGYVRCSVSSTHPLARRANGQGVSHFVYEHKLIAFELLGEPTIFLGDVHHRNEDRTDNRPENLIYFTSRSLHIKHHRNMQKGMTETESFESMPLGSVTKLGELT